MLQFPEFNNFDRETTAMSLGISYCSCGLRTQNGDVNLTQFVLDFKLYLFIIIVIYALINLGYLARCI